MTSLATTEHCRFYGSLRAIPTIPANAPISHLPTEMILQIIQHLDPKSLRRTAYVSKQLRHIAGPLVYKSQNAADVERLVRIKVLADQPDVGRMILNLDIDAASMDYWWLGTVRLLESILPKLSNLEGLSLRTSHPLPSSLSNVISELPYLHTLRVQLQDASLGKHISCVGRLKHLALDVPMPLSETDGETAFFTSPATMSSFVNMFALTRNSTETLESICLRSHDHQSTSNLVHFIHTPPSHLQPSFKCLLQSCPNLVSVCATLEVRDTLSALQTVDALSGLPVTSLSLKCKPSMFPDAPSEGYGIGVEVLRRICETLPLLRELKVEDGEVGKRNLTRPADGSVFEDHIKYLRKLRFLQVVDIPILLDDLLQHVPARPSQSPDQVDAQLPPVPLPPRPSSHHHPLSAPRIEFEANVNDIVTRTTQGLFASSQASTCTSGCGSASCPLPTRHRHSQTTTRTTNQLFLLHETSGSHRSLNSRSSHPTSDHDNDTNGDEEPLPHLKDLRFRILPTPKLARDLRGVRVYVPAVIWVKKVVGAAEA